jgi:DNA-binding CsgD family transcriptional regulator
MKCADATPSQMEGCILTKRELQCLEGLALGLSNSDIAKQLGISLPTVALHLSNARRKLEAKTREQAIAIAVSRKMITLNDSE